MLDVKAQSIANLRAQIKAIEEDSGAHGRSEARSSQCNGNASRAQRPHRRYGTAIDAQRNPASLPCGCSVLANSENDKQRFSQAKQTEEERDQANSAFAKIQRLLCIREHASALLYKRLLASGYEEHIASEAVQRAIDCGLVSDERYADVLVRSRLSQGKGLRGIAFELEQADIDPCSVPAYQDAISNENGPDELTRALYLLDAKPPNAKRMREAAYRKLVQKGYASSVAASAARIFEERCRCDALSAH